MRTINKIIIHCSATFPKQKCDVEIIRGWHTDPKKPGGPYQDIGYHFVILRDGTVASGRPLELVGAHTLNHNKNSIGICLVGGLQDGSGGDANNDGIIEEFENGQRGKPEANYTPEQWAALQSLVTRLSKEYPKATIHGHNEFAAKACPCFGVPKWWAGVQ